MNPETAPEYSLPSGPGASRKNPAFSSKTEGLWVQSHPVRIPKNFSSEFFEPMRYYVKVNGNVLEETYPADEIQGYAPAWREYQAEVEVASDWNGPFISLGQFLGEPEPPPAVLPPPFALPGPGPATMAPPPPPPAEGFAALQNFQSSAQAAAEAAPPLDPGNQIPYTRNGMARLGVGLALLGLILVVFTRVFGPMLCVAGIVCSIVGLKHVRDEPAIYGGKGLATNGIVTGSIGLVVTLIMLAFPPAKVELPSLSSGNSADFPAITLRQINSAQAVYEAGIGRGNYAQSLAELGQLQMLQPDVLGLETKPQGGFKAANLQVVTKSTTSAAQYSLNLLPVKDDGSPRSGDYSYFVDESGIIRRSAKTDELATRDSPPFEAPSTPNVTPSTYDPRVQQQREEMEKMQRQRDMQDFQRGQRPN